MKKESSLAAIQSLSPNYREQKSREQAAFQKVARGNPEMIKQAHVLSGLAKSAKLVFDPSVIKERTRYGY